MTLASLGWGTWWVTLALVHWAPEHAPSLVTPSIIGGVFGGLGLLAALFSLRARLAWILFTLVPLCANTGVILVPVVIKTLRFIRAEQSTRLEIPPDAASSERDRRGH